MASALVAAETPSADANPYSVISDRNVFHLNPPPPPPAPAEPKPVDLPKVMLTGFVGKGNSMKVLIAIPPKDAKETTYYTSLVPGQKDHDVELVRIHAAQEEVEIINSGTPQTLSVKSNSYLATASAPPAKGGGPPGMPPGIGLRHQPPGFPPASAVPQPPPSAANTSSGGGSAIVAGGGGDGSAIVAGGNEGGNASSSFGASAFGASGASSSGTIVSGGAGYAQTPTAAAGNNVGNQIASTLFNPATGRYQMPAPAGPPAAREVQQAALLLRQAAGGPPVPPSVQQAAADAEGADGGGIPLPPSFPQ